MHRLRLLIVVASIAVLAACQFGSKNGSDPRTSSAAAAKVRDNLSTLTPYVPPKRISSPKPPPGFEPVFAENVSRHGSRSLTSNDLIDPAIALWSEAKQQGALTKAGKTFGPAAMKLRDAMDQVGFGNLSTRGEQELRGMGRREGKRLSAMFEHAVADGAPKVDILDSGSGRAEESATAFSEGLKSVQPGLQIEPPESNEKMLHFDTEDKAFKHFLFGGSWKTDYNQVRQLAHIDTAATDTLTHLYKSDFVATIDNPLGAANAVFDVYRSGPAMSGDVRVDTAPLMSRKDADAFAYVDDGRYFYARGPGVEGDDRSYAPAQILLDDFFTVIDDRLQNRGPHPHAAVYRFAHAEEIVPLAALLGLPGSDEQAKPGVPYTPKNNDFRIRTVSPLAGNIEWTVWKKGETVLVSINHNEKPTTVGRDCQLYEGTKLFYELEELRSCLGASVDLGSSDTN